MSNFNLATLRLLIYYCWGSCCSCSWGTARKWNNDSLSCLWHTLLTHTNIHTQFTPPYSHSPQQATVSYIPMKIAPHLFVWQFPPFSTCFPLLSASSFYLPHPSPSFRSLFPSCFAFYLSLVCASSVFSLIVAWHMRNVLYFNRKSSVSSLPYLFLLLLFPSHSPTPCCLSCSLWLLSVCLHCAFFELRWILTNYSQTPQEFCFLLDAFLMSAHLELFRLPVTKQEKQENWKALLAV